MHKPKKNVTRTWDLLNEGNFSVSKSDVPFTAIGLDHGIGIIAAFHIFRGDLKISDKNNWGKGWGGYLNKKLIFFFEGAKFTRKPMNPNVMVVVLLKLT